MFKEMIGQMMRTLDNSRKNAIKIKHTIVLIAQKSIGLNKKINA